MNKELLSPDNLASTMKNRLCDLKIALEEIKKQQENVPEGHLRVNFSRNRVQCYHVTTKDKKHGKYIRRKDQKLAYRLAQKDYNHSVIQKLEQQIDFLEKNLKLYNELDVNSPYNMAGKHRKPLITPVTFPDSEYVQYWLKNASEQEEFRQIESQFYTTENVHVRSKSELIIANTLERYKIPYKYEVLLEKGKIRFHPDFFCLNIKNRQSFYWEHFGMMDDPEYAQRAIEKIAAYTAHNFVIGKNFIATFETAVTPLNTRQIEKLIETYLA